MRERERERERERWKKGRVGRGIKNEKGRDLSTALRGGVPPTLVNTRAMQY